MDKALGLSEMERITLAQMEWVINHPKSGGARNWWHSYDIHNPDFLRYVADRATHLYQLVDGQGSLAEVLRWWADVMEVDPTAIARLTIRGVVLDRYSGDILPDLKARFGGIPTFLEEWQQDGGRLLIESD